MEEQSCLLRGFMLIIRFGTFMGIILFIILECAIFLDVYILSEQGKQTSGIVVDYKYIVRQSSNGRKTYYHQRIGL